MVFPDGSDGVPLHGVFGEGRRRQLRTPACSLTEVMVALGPGRDSSWTHVASSGLPGGVGDLDG